MSAPTVFFIDDQASVRHAISEMLSVYGFAVETFASAEAFLAKTPRPGPACIVSDVRMPGMDGLDLVRECRKTRRSMPIILISGHADVPMAVAAIKAGAEDMIEKPVDDAQLVAAINRSLVRELDTLSQDAVKEQVTARFERLTNRQAEVFDLVVAGYTSPEIAARLEISPRTVESYRAQIMERMQADSLAALVRQAVQIGRTP